VLKWRDDNGKRQPDFPRKAIFLAWYRAEYTKRFARQQRLTTSPAYPID
jgi:hypothetical protein